MGFKAVVFRYFNACGFDIEANIVPTHQSHLIYNVLEVAKGDRECLEVYGNDYETFDGTCIRDYVHVKDIALPHILALEKLTLNEQSLKESSRESVQSKADLPSGITSESRDLNNSSFEVYNIGTGKGFSVWEVANRASEILNRIIPMQVAERRPGDAVITVADNTKLLTVLGYQPKFSDLENMILTSWQILKDI